MKSRDDQELTNTVRANLGSLIIKLSLCTDASFPPPPLPPLLPLHTELYRQP